MQILIGHYSYNRDLLPEIDQLNVYFERTPANLKDQVALLTRPALGSVFATVGDGPIRGMFREENVFLGDLLVVSGNTIYRVKANGATTSLGSLIYGGHEPQCAFTPDEALFANGGVLRVTDGVTVSDVAFPTTQDIISVAYLNGYKLAVPEQTSQIYYSDLVTGEFTANRFISAERYPDVIMRIVIVGDEIWAFGPSSLEIFAATGQDTSEQPPFQRIEGRAFKAGCVNEETIVEIDNSVIWVGRNADGGFVVYRAAGVPQIISDNSVAERLQRANPLELRAWAFGMTGHAFYVLEVGDQGTWVYDVSTGYWFEWSWAVHTGRGCWPGVILAGGLTGTLYRLSDTAASDNGQRIQQSVVGGLIVDGTPSNDNVTLECSVGDGGGNIALSYSDDFGETFTSAGAKTLGAVGAFSTRVRWNRLGMMKPPARIFKWTTEDTVRLRISGARINDEF